MKPGPLDAMPDAILLGQRAVIKDYTIDAGIVNRFLLLK
jgi:hypothetical protein